MNFYLINPLKLNPIEAYSNERVDWLSKKIISEGYWSKPIAIAKEHNLVMDGHHRLQASIKLGLIKVPCFIYSYKDIIPYSLRDNVEVTSSKIIENFLLSKIYPNKTAKHDLPIYKFKARQYATKKNKWNLPVHEFWIINSSRRFNYFS